MNETAIVVSAIPLVLGLVEVAKIVGLPSKFAPLVALTVGVTYALSLNGVSALTIVEGITYGLSASGLYTGTKTVVSAIQETTSTPNDTTTQPSDPATPPEA